MSLSRFGRFTKPVLALAVTAFASAGCASTATGTGQGSASAVVTHAPSTPESSPSSTTGSTSASMSATSTAGTGAACTNHAYCATFDTAADAWSTQNTTKYAVGWSNYLGGTFRMTERHASTLPEQAPVDISKFSPTDSVQIDVNAIVGSGSPVSAEYGVTCWNKQISSGGTAAFTFFFGRQGAEIGLWDYIDGNYHQIKATRWNNVVQPAPYENEVRVLCVQGQDKYGTVAKLGLAVNGRTLIAQYAKSVKTYEWQPTNHVGLLVSGTGADVFYDDFGVTAYQ